MIAIASFSNIPITSWANDRLFAHHSYLTKPTCFRAEHRSDRPHKPIRDKHLSFPCFNPNPYPNSSGDVHKLCRHRYPKVVIATVPLALLTPRPAPPVPPVCGLTNPLQFRPQPCCANFFADFLSKARDSVELLQIATYNMRANC